MNEIEQEKNELCRIRNKILSEESRLARLEMRIRKKEVELETLKVQLLEVNSRIHMVKNKAKTIRERGGVLNPIEVRLHTRWRKMKMRHKKKETKMCDDWRCSFENFYKWVKFIGFQDGDRIVRINKSDGWHHQNIKILKP